jgi:hypothetical protein
MKKALAVLLLTMSAAAVAETPLEMYSMSKNFTNRTTITIVPVANVQARCEAESRKRNLGGFGYGVDACSFWVRNGENSTCTIVVGLQTNNDTLGHEMRHCLQGAFH